MAQEQHEKSVSQFKEKLRMPLDSLFVCLAFTLESSLDNFRGPSLDVELISGTLEIVLCYPCMLLKFYMMAANVLPALPFMPPNILIFMDTGAAVLACYVLLLDINWSFIWLITFPIFGIFFICALSRLYSKHYSRGEDREEARLSPVHKKKEGEDREEAGVITSSQKKEGEDREEAGIIPCSPKKEGEDREKAGVIPCLQKKEGEDREEAGVIPSSEKKEGEDSHGEANQGSKGENLSTRSTGGSSNEKTTRVILLELQFIGIITFGALWAMDELLLDEDATERFTISQFLLFLSFMLAALTCMMMRLPAGISPGIAPASELLHKTLLVLLLVTAHTVAAEALGEEVVLLCMPEVIPAVLIWFSIHHGSVSANVLDVYKKWRGAVVALLFAIIVLVRPGWCPAILVYCAVSGLLAHYVVFMLSHWPGQQPAGKEDPGKLAVKLLKHWANDLLIAAAASLLIRYLLVHGLGWREALDALSQNFQRLNSAAKGHTNTFWSIMPLVGSALFNLLCSSMKLHTDFPGITTLQKSFGICYNVFLGLHMCCFTDDAYRTVYIVQYISTKILRYFGKECSAFL